MDYRAVALLGLRCPLGPEVALRAATVTRGRITGRAQLALGVLADAASDTYLLRRPSRDAQSFVCRAEGLGETFRPYFRAQGCASIVL
ncbi:hypothetical protein [Ferrimicrobium acidiphilum]|jgi:hypothetical protein|uniref:hypothetical protein n=1 Tax=Ferrimicrobium acidiphilum TaxID=121039 RepID=UPI0034DD9DA9